MHMKMAYRCRGLTLAYLFALCGVLSAQGHDHLWLGGYNNASTDTLLGGWVADFNTDPPRFYLQKRKVDLGIYTTVCSDSTGRKLLFYSNGISVQDASHNVMLFGDTINPGEFWEQWKHRDYPMGAPFCFPLPAPGKNNQYYLFHVGLYYDKDESIFMPAPFYYTLIDMNGNNGLGKVLKKNQIILPINKDIATPVAVKHGNGRDWWVITGDHFNRDIFVFLVDPQGVHGPFKQVMPTRFPGEAGQGICSMSPDGRTYVRCDFYNGLYIFDFNRCNGTFSNLRLLPTKGFNMLATVFSPDSRHLFISNTENVMSLDLASPNPVATLDTLAYFDGFAAPFNPFRTWFFIPKLAPNGKIYYATTNSTLALHVVHRPDWPGQASDLEQHGVVLPRLNSGSMIASPNYRLGEFEAAPCDTLNRQPPDDGFEKSHFGPMDGRNIQGYTVWPAVGGGKSQPAERPQEEPSPLLMPFRYSDKWTEPYSPVKKDKQ